MSTISMTINPDVLTTLARCTGIIATKMLATNIMSVFPAIKAGCHAPEDSAMAAKSGAPPQTFGIGTEDSKDKSLLQHKLALARANRVVMNDLENIPIGLLVLWVAAFVNPTPEVALLAKIFCAGRVAHSVIYSLGIPYVRGIAFFAGVGSTVRAIYLILAA